MKLKSKKGAPGGSRHGAVRRHDRGGNFHTDEGHITADCFAICGPLCRHVEQSK